MYYICMVQPKSPPLSIRLPAQVLAAVDRVAAASGLKRHAVIVALISEGVVCAERAAPLNGPSLIAGDVIERGPVVEHGNGIATQEVRFGPVESAPGSRLKPPKGSK